MSKIIRNYDFKNKNHTQNMHQDNIEEKIQGTFEFPSSALHVVAASP